MFGTNEGFLRFNPEKLKPRTTNSSIYFTDLFVNNQIATIGEKLPARTLNCQFRQDYHPPQPELIQIVNFLNGHEAIPKKPVRI